ncbi:MAG: NADH-quinone oxidoreductase subunit K [Pseudomonadales bacterium]
MQAPQLYVLAGAALVGLGLYGLFAYRHLLRQIIALNIMSGGVFLVLIASASSGSVAAVDPIPRAMVLTGVVVAVSATALALALAVRLRRVTGVSCLSIRDEEDAQ